MLPEHFIIPSNLDLRGMIERRRLAHYYGVSDRACQRALMIITMIYWYGLINSYGREGAGLFAYLSYDHMKQVLGCERPKRIIDMLIELGVIRKCCDHVVGEHGAGYEIKAPYLGRDLVEVEIELVVLARSIRRYNRRFDRLRPTRDGIHSVLQENLSHFGVSDMRYEIYVACMDQTRRSYRDLCKKMLDRDSSFFSVSPRSGRVFSVLTSMPKEMRRILLIDGCPTCEIDIPSSQPLLCATFYNHVIDSHVAERERYIRFVRSDFYRSLADLAGYSDVNRDRVKTECYSCIFFNNRVIPCSLWISFQGEFPILARMIVERKRRNSGRLLNNAGFAINLQQIEADLVISRVAQSLHDERIIFGTVHDSIVCRTVDRDRVWEIFDQALTEEIGFSGLLTRPRRRRRERF